MGGGVVSIVGWTQCGEDSFTQANKKKYFFPKKGGSLNAYIQRSMPPILIMKRNVSLSKILV